MNAIKPSQDVIPLSKFRAHVAEYLRQAQETGRPVVITQHGRGTAVLLSSEEFGKLVDEMDLMRSILRGQSDAIAGRTVPHEQVMAELEEIVRKSEQKHKSRKKARKRKAA